MQQIDVPGMGVVEFPDDMTDDQISAAIKRNMGGQKQESRIGGKDKSVADDMNALQKFVAGFGSTIPRAYQGMQQITSGMALGGSGLDGSGNVTDPSAAAYYAQEAEKQKRLTAEIDQQNQELGQLGGFGTAGRVTGNIGLGLPAMALPGVGGAMASGALMGALEPTGTGDSRLQNMAFDAAGGGFGYAIPKAIPHAYRGLKAAFEPFFKGGQEKIAGRTIAGFAGNADDAARNIASATEVVKGSSPTSAEVAKDAGVAQLQRTLANQDPKLAKELADRALDQNSARLAAMHEITKYGGNLDDAMTRRAEAGAKLYEKAFGQQIRVDETIKTLTSRPSFKSALERAQRIAEEEGVPIKNLFEQQGKFASTRGLHYVKMGFDDLINDAPKSGIGNTELRAIKATRGKLLDWMSENNPSYQTARVRFEKMSRPINREEVAREITSKATRNQLPNMRGEANVYPDSFARTMRDDGSAIVQSVTGRVGKSLDDVMTPSQMKKLSNIREDLSRTVIARDSGRAAGSNTAQNLASQNLLNQLGVPQNAAQNTMLQTLLRPYSFATKLSEPNIQNILSEAMLDPKYAAKLIQMIKQQNKQGLLSQATPYAGGLLAPSIYSSQ